MRNDYTLADYIFHERDRDGIIEEGILKLPKVFKISYELYGRKPDPYLEDYQILITSNNENFNILLDFYGIEDIRKLINKLYIFEDTIYIKENILPLQAISVCNNLIKSKFRRPFNLTEDILCEY
jgi:hypothetical protein